MKSVDKMQAEMIECIIRYYKEYRRLGNEQYVGSITSSVMQLILDNLFPYIQKYDKSIGDIVILPKEPYIGRYDKVRWSISKFI